MDHAYLQSLRTRAKDDPRYAEAQAKVQTIQERIDRLREDLRAVDASLVDAASGNDAAFDAIHSRRQNLIARIASLESSAALALDARDEVEDEATLAMRMEDAQHTREQAQGAGAEYLQALEAFLALAAQVQAAAHKLQACANRRSELHMEMRRVCGTGGAYAAPGVPAYVAGVYAATSAPGGADVLDQQRHMVGMDADVLDADLQGLQRPTVDVEPEADDATSDNSPRWRATNPDAYWTPMPEPGVANWSHAHRRAA